MFRRLSASLPVDPVFPQDLKELGYFINASDQIKKIDFPAEDFQFFLTNNERYNVVQREAMHGCIRKEVISRMAALGVPPLYLPQFTTTKPHAPHIPILATPAAELRCKKRVLVFVNEHVQDLGIWAYRDLSRAGGLDGGSVVSIARQALQRFTNSDGPGIVVLNPGQLLYSYAANLAMNTVTWVGQPRPSVVHPPPRIDPEHNRVPGHETPAAHVKAVFDGLLDNAAFVAPDAQLYLVGCSDGGAEVLQYLLDNWPRWHTRIAAIALTESYFALPSPASSSAADAATQAAFRAFLAARARAYAVCAHPLNTPLANPTLGAAQQKPRVFSSTLDVSGMDLGGGDGKEDGESEVLCPRLSSGVPSFAECILGAVSEAVLEWFGEVEAAGEGYENPVFEVEAVERPVMEQVGLW